MLRACGEMCNSAERIVFYEYEYQLQILNDSLWFEQSVCGGI